MNAGDINTPCTGCGACKFVCPFGAVSILKNRYGFYAASVDKGLCTSCGKCAEVCPKSELYSRDDREREYFCASNRDDGIRVRSSSGGLFSAMEQYVSDNGGVTFGVRYTPDFSGTRYDSTDSCSVDSLRGSKYCQSSTEGLFPSIETALMEKRMTLVTGTPCEIEAVRKVFGNDENLILADFVCGGVPSENIFRDYTRFLADRFGSEITALDFRDKKYGWKNPTVSVKFRNGREYHSKYQYDMYYYYFYSTCFTKNDACLSCRFKQHNAADITIGDFWGYKSAGIKPDDKGLSLMTVNTSRGKELTEKIAEKLSLQTVDYCHIEYIYKNKEHSPGTLTKRADFLSAAERDGFVAAARGDYFKSGKAGVFFRRVKKRLLHR